MTDMFTFACSKDPDRWSGPSTLVEVAGMLANIAREGHECVHTIELVEDFEPECTCMYRTSYCLNCPVSVEPEPAKPDYDWARLRRLETEFLGLDAWDF